MKVLQINTVHAIKSTGRTCSEVEKALLRHGHECCTAYGNGPKNMGPNSYQIDTRAEYLFHNMMSRLTGLEGYFSYFATKRLIHFIRTSKPNVIHLRNLHGHYLNLPMLFRFLAKADIPVVQNLHDCWAYTGGCCYYTTQGCDRWKTECHDCPKKKQYPKSYFFDWSRKMRRDKEKWYGGIKNLTVVGVSKWISDEAKQSFLGKTDVRYIYNWINRDVFHPYDENAETRRKYRIPEDKFVILGVSSIWAEGSPRYEDFMKLAQQIDDSQIVVMVGSAASDLTTEKIVHIPFVSDIQELAKLYSCADTYIHCSVEDTFGKVIAEAMSCGTPVVVYDVTACPELVKEGCGFVVEPRNVNAVLRCIHEIQSGQSTDYRENCVKNVTESFDYERNTEKLIALYQSVLKKSACMEGRIV